LHRERGRRKWTCDETQDRQSWHKGKLTEQQTTIQTFHEEFKKLTRVSGNLGEGNSEKKNCSERHKAKWQEFLMCRYLQEVMKGGEKKSINRDGQVQGGLGQERQIRGSARSRKP